MSTLNECLNCGMLMDARQRHCPKCDNRLDLQTDGTTRTVDVAHQGERVSDALRKMRAEIRETKLGLAKYLRLVVGSGVIREEVMNTLGDLLFQKQIIDYHLDDKNSGVILVQLKP